MSEDNPAFLLCSAMTSDTGVRPFISTHIRRGRGCFGENIQDGGRGQIVVTCFFIFCQRIIRGFMLSGKTIQYFFKEMAQPREHMGSPAIINIRPSRSPNRAS